LTRADITDFLFPNKLVRYAGAAGGVGTLLETLGVRKGSIVIVADRIVHENGLTATLLQGLVAAGYAPHMFAEIAGEPEIEMVEKATAIAAETEAAAFVGIGGGSALDTAKLVAYNLVSGAPLRDLKGPVSLVDGFGPLVMIPTTVGTGAEATRVAMFSVEGAKRPSCLRSSFPRSPCSTKTSCTGCRLRSWRRRLWTHCRIRSSP